MGGGTSELDNPIWATLGSDLSQFGGASGDTRWFLEDIAPFVAVPSAYVMPNLDAALSGGMGSAAYFVGVCPSTLPRGWHYVAHSQILQMIPPNLFSSEEASLGQELRMADQDKMFELAQIAFPFFFRRRTAELGSYLGVLAGDRLVAMAGERMRMGEWQEISGVCTHPDHVGKGYARKLTRSLLKRHAAAGLRSFLHVSESNTGARKLYSAMGFAVRAIVPMGRVERLVAP
jgi:GNAT superfamily N-acetyltransferase